MAAQGSAAKCDDGMIRSQPGYGCAFFQREPGADDEPGPPESIDDVIRKA
jgi:hypothetical protein